MNSFFYFFLFLFGTLFGSFASVIIYRLKSGEKGIMTGRSHCARCNNILGAFQLIPIVSWVFNKGKCYYCRDKISHIYPLLEISTGILFSLIGYFLIDFDQLAMFNYLEIYKLFFWLIIGFVSIIYTFYDILFLEIHDGVMFFGILLILITIGAQTVFPSFNVVNSLPVGMDDLKIGISSIILSFVIIGMLYAVMLKELNEIWDILIILFSTILLYGYKMFFGIDLGDITILSGTAGVLGIFIFFFLQIVISKGAWLGGGDLRIAILIGLLLGISLSFAGTMMTYLVGSILGIGFVLSSKIKNGFKTKFDTMIPFGPFLAIGFFTTIFLKSDILKFIEIYFGNM